MKNFLLMLMVATVVGLSSNKVLAQYEKGDKLVNVGVGLGTYGLIGTGGLPLNASAEYGFTDQISGGLYAAIVSSKYLGGDWRYSYVYVGPRASYHFNDLLKINIEQLDIYGGAGIYARNYSAKWKGSGSALNDYKTSSTDVVLALHAGARYYFQPAMSAWAEVGYGASPLQLGISFKF